MKCEFCLLGILLLSFHTIPTTLATPISSDSHCSGTSFSLFGWEPFGKPHCTTTVTQDNLKPENGSSTATTTTISPNGESQTITTTTNGDITATTNNNNNNNNNVLNNCMPYGTVFTWWGGPRGRLAQCLTSPKNGFNCCNRNGTQIPPAGMTSIGGGKWKCIDPCHSLIPPSNNTGIL